jgi:hypothetical protein
MNDIENGVRVALGIGLESRDMEVWQMVLRAAIVYAVTLAMVRLGKKRFMGKATAFDMILGIMLGSIVSRAITGNAPLVPALAVTATLIALHSDQGPSPRHRLQRQQGREGDADHPPHRPRPRGGSSPPRHDKH